MFSNSAILLILLAAVLYIVLIPNDRIDGFSTNGMRHPEGYCNRIMDVYYKPSEDDSPEKLAAQRKMCENAI
jgi:hypothetical protein